MKLFLEILLYFCVFLILNSFVFYPVIIYLLSLFKSSGVRTPKYYPKISILIAAYNEEKVIAERIKNIAEMDYDFDKVELFIGSDCSTDNTNSILQEYSNLYPWLKIFLSKNRMGKAGILNELIKSVNGEILLFSDANTHFKKDVLKNIIHDFQDRNVGGVCGRLILTDIDDVRKGSVEETNYWAYETFIKKAEGKLGIQISANGGIFAIRKELFREIPLKNAVTDDLFISLSVVAQGYKFTYSENSIAYENIGKDVRQEFNRKVRFSATNFETLVFHKSLLNGKNFLLSYAFFSHKVTRWILPFLLISIFLLSLIVSQFSLFVQLLFLFQIVFYIAGIAGYLLALEKIRIPFFSLPYFFIVANIAILQGFKKFIQKKHSVIWESTER